MKTMLSLLLAMSGLFPFGANASVVPGKYFNRAVIVVFENTNYKDALKQPFFSQLATNGANLTNFIAEAHPSQANYIALTAGTLGGVKGDGHYDLNLTNIVDLLESHGISWKVYAEGFPGNCYLGMNKGQYYRKHNPFISFLNIQSDQSRCAKIVGAREFDADVQAGTLPQYVFYVPDARNDGHDTGVAFADKWYRKKFEPLIQNPDFNKDTILISTFDESGASAKNLIYTSIFGGVVRPGAYGDEVNHYSLLRLVEDNWGLGNLGRSDANAPEIPAIWK